MLIECRVTNLLLSFWQLFTSISYTITYLVEIAVRDMTAYLRKYLEVVYV